MNGPFDYDLAMQHHHDLIDTAARMRLARQARKVRRSRRLWNR